MIAIIGGGLAGLTAAIHLSKAGQSVMVFEKKTYPHHKVCGEFISNEVVNYLASLAINLHNLEPNFIKHTTITTQNGKDLKTALPLGGFGISRYKLDYFLYQMAHKQGCIFIHQTVEEITFKNNQFQILTANHDKFEANMVLGAYGKRSQLDKFFNRDFIHKKSPWLGVKAHYKLNFPNNLVELHNFPGGYCGVSNVEDNLVNICYLTKYSEFKKYKNLTEFQENVLHQNPQLKSILSNAKMVFDKPLTISQVSFENKTQVQNHMLMIGDTAGFIHPLCGNGMAIAMHSAKIASELTLDFMHQKISREQLETHYTKRWQKQFKRRLFFGQLLSKILLHPKRSHYVFNLLKLFPSLLPMIIKQTHGKPF